MHCLYLACGWYVFDTCWNNIFNRKQCSTAVHGQVKIKNAVDRIAKWTTRTVDFAAPAGHVLLRVWYWRTCTWLLVFCLPHFSNCYLLHQPAASIWLQIYPRLRCWQNVEQATDVYVIGFTYNHYRSVKCLLYHPMKTSSCDYVMLTYSMR